MLMIHLSNDFGNTDYIIFLLFLNTDFCCALVMIITIFLIAEYDKKKITNTCLKAIVLRFFL